ncbi:MAG: ABC transporter ATP-binding protein, partial [Bacillota bacterium]|nr:ABC transporter ATP-binding protein [Bacillota bacterium]
ISSDVNSVQAVITSLFSSICKVLIIICMTLFIIIQTPVIALGILCLVIFCFAISQVVFRKPMRRFGVSSRDYSFRASQASLEAIQGHKEILVFGRQDYFVNEYLKNMIGYNKAEVQMSVASAAPSFLIEVVCMIGLLTIVAVQSIMTGGDDSLLTQMVTIALAALRILPALGALLGNVNSIIFHAPGLNGASDTLHMVNELDKGGKIDREHTKEAYDDIHFEKELMLSHVSYAYPKTQKNVIDDLSMTITKGTSVGFIGTSGAGKTTLADIILGLLKPQNGEILMDGVSIETLGEAWHHIIGYVPQSIYMTDASIRRNVAFGIDEALIDDDKVWKALEMAQIKEFVEGLSEGIDTKVGEWGVQLSGGQRQRIAIARALYNEPDIIVLDEATAALDNETESAVMESIEALQKVKTLIIVAHRLTTIRKCDVIYEVIDGKAVMRNKEEVCPIG